MVIPSMHLSSLYLYHVLQCMFVLEDDLDFWFHFQSLDPLTALYAATLYLRL